MDFLLKLLAGKGAGVFLKLGGYVKQLEESDKQLQALAAGQSVEINLPDELDVKFDGKSGKRYSVDGVVVKRLK